MLKNKKWSSSEIKKYWADNWEMEYVRFMSQLGDTSDSKVQSIIKKNSQLAYKDDGEVLLQSTIDNKPVR